MKLYQTKKFRWIIWKIKNYSEIVFDTETTSLNTLVAEIVWVSIYLDDENIFYINHKT